MEDHSIIDDSTIDNAAALLLGIVACSDNVSRYILDLIQGCCSWPCASHTATSLDMVLIAFSFPLPTQSAMRTKQLY